MAYCFELTNDTGPIANQCFLFTPFGNLVSSACIRHLCPTAETKKMRYDKYLVRGDLWEL